MPYLIYLTDEDEYVTGVQPGCVAHAGSVASAKRFPNSADSELRDAIKTLERCEVRYQLQYVSPGEV